MIPTPAEISNFLELYTNRHLSNTAIRLGVTQPSLSQSLQRLESKIGASLFIRTKRGMIPTAAGKNFYSRAKVLIDDWNAVTSEISIEAESLKGRFRVGCHPAVGAYTVPRLLQKLNEAAPEIEIDLIHDFSRNITERLVAYEIDFAFVINPTRHPDLILTEIGEDRVTFWQRPGRKIPKRLITDANTQQLEDLLKKVSRTEFEGWKSMNSSSLELIRTLCIDGQGVGILPERVAKADSSPLVQYDSRLPSIRDSIYLAYRREVLKSKAGKTVAAFAKIRL